MTLTLKTAKEIVENSNACDYTLTGKDRDREMRASGFLEGHATAAKKANGLTNALKIIANHIQYEEAVDANLIMKTIFEALETYQKDLEE